MFYIPLVACVLIALVSPSGMAQFYSEPMDTDPGWTMGGEWEFGAPAGLNGDPVTAHTGTNVYGYDLTSNQRYENNRPEHNLTTGVIDCTGRSNIHLSFAQWLGVELVPCDHAYVRISNNEGMTWNDVWANGPETINETAWTIVDFDISTWADNQAGVMIRWTMGVTDDSVVYHGWNIDDVQLREVILATLTMLDPGGAGTGTISPTAGVHTCWQGEYIDLNAVPDAGSSFNRWEVDGSTYSADASTTLLIEGNHSVQAFFDLCEVVCPSGGVSESEACGDDTNGGCNMAPGTEMFEPISPSQTVCGTLWADGNNRDTDWFMITATECTEYTFTGSAEMPFFIGYAEYDICHEGSGSCEDILGHLNPAANGLNCDTLTVVVTVEPGSHMFFIAPIGYSGYPCGTANNYCVMLTASPGTPSSVYCDVAVFIEDEFISNVTFGTINNTTGWDGYGDYTAQSTAIDVASTYMMTITLTGGYISDEGAVYIDWNHDFDFCDLDEAFTTLTGSPGAGPYSCDITVPDHAVNGSTRMRVSMNYGAAPFCGTTTYGDYEDYTVVISGGVIPTVTPIPSPTPEPVPATGPAGIALLMFAIGALMSLAGLLRR